MAEIFFSSATAISLLELIIVSLADTYINMYVFIHTPLFLRGLQFNNIEDNKINFR